MEDKIFDYVAKGVFFFVILAFFSFFTIGVEWCLTKIGFPIAIAQGIVELVFCLVLTIDVMNCIEEN